MSNTYAISRNITSLLLLLTLAQCRTPETGCTDIEAVNYTISADEPCPDDMSSECCTYPLVSLRFNHLYRNFRWPYDTLPLSYNSLLYQAEDTLQPFRVARIKYYLSDFEFITDEGTVTRVEDTIYLPISNGAPQLFTADAVYVDASPDISSTPTIGTYREDDLNYSALRFKIGLSTPIQATDINGLPAGNRYGYKADSLNYQTGEGYIFNQLWYLQDTFPPSDTLKISTFVEAQTLTFQNISYTFETGKNREVVLNVYYHQWFEGIDMNTASETQIQQHLTNQMAESFHLVEVRSE